MTNAVQINTAKSGSPAATPATPTQGVPDGWRDLQENSDIQFEEIDVLFEPPEPSPFLEAIVEFFSWFGQFLGPIAQALSGIGPILWVLPGLVVAFVVYLIVRRFGRLDSRRKAKSEANAASEPDWRPDREESLALLEDADALAAEGKFDEATHLLLKRSVGQIAEARPEWVEPSSTARELAALPLFSGAARSAFAVISERVERSLFALRSLNRSDWEAARSAYANFALAQIAGEQEALR